MDTFELPHRSLQPVSLGDEHAPTTRDGDLLVAVVHAAMDSLARQVRQPRRLDTGAYARRYALESLLQSLLARPLPFERDDLERLLGVALSSDDVTWQPWRGILASLERYSAVHGVPAEFRPRLCCIRAALTRHDLATAYRPLVRRIDAFLEAMTVSDGDGQPASRHGGWAHHTTR